MSLLLQNYFFATVEEKSKGFTGEIHSFPGENWPYRGCDGRISWWERGYASQSLV